ncbi:MAG TPA: hypothetical protein VK604_12550 [Bryobacteraceae bacterium]|nr:hypothetical protein [Bryobacteraceae bacterium]
MLRGLILLLLLGLTAFLVLPFLISSLYIDWRGVTIPGTVYSKREDVGVRYSTLKRSSEITVEYSKPDGTGVSFLTTQFAPIDYDAMRVGQAVSLHYLRPQDVPDLPLSKFLRGAQLLPTVRLADQQIFSGLKVLFTGQAATFAVTIAAAAILLLFWRMTRIPKFGWAVGVCVLLTLIAVMVEDFPRPMPPPAVAVRQGLGRVKTVDRIDKLFNGSRSRGLVADQPIEVIGVEFTPQGRTEPVLAVDLIDAGSLPGLKEKSSVPVDYESSSPRTAYIRGATRKFVSRNLAGIGIQAIACLVVLAVIVIGTRLLGKGFNRLTRRS